MAHQGQNNPAGPGNIQRFEITSSKDSESKVDIGPGIQDLRYYEVYLPIR